MGWAGPQVERVPVAQLLRQAAVFRHLFRSCFDADPHTHAVVARRADGRGGLQAGLAAAHGVPTFEISARAPEWLS